MITDRPDVAEASRTVGQFVLQLEAGLDAGLQDAAVAMPTKLRFGLLEWAEIHLEGDIIGLDAEDNVGLADLDVGGKVNILDTGVFSLGALVAVTMPIGGEGVGGETVLSPTLASDIELLSWVALGVNLGLDAPLSERETSDDVLRFAASLGWTANDELGLFTEVFGLIPLGDDAAEISSDAGVTVALTPDTQFDGYLRLADINGEPNWGAGAGFSFRL